MMAPFFHPLAMFDSTAWWDIFKPRRRDSDASEPELAGVSEAVAASGAEVILLFDENDPEPKFPMGKKAV